MRRMEDVPLTLATARCAVRLRDMLDRGFTTVRDTGGTDWGVKTAVEQGLLVGPRLFIAGRSIGPTGGHSDGRGRTNTGYPATAATLSPTCARWSTARTICAGSCASRCARAPTT
jgi:imidazolonepropionase-like amidohydrolase